MWNFGWVLFEMTVGRSPDLKKLSLLAQSKGRFPDLAELAAQCTLGVVPDGRLVLFQGFPNLEKLVTECIRIVPGARPEILAARRILEKHFQMSP